MKRLTEDGTLKNRDLQESVVFLLYCFFVVNVWCGDEEEHREKKRMEEEGMLKRMIEIFKEWKETNIKRNLCLIVLNVRKTCELKEEEKEMIVWF
jgi:hypothetical protein